jgi:hypothetical protein
MCQLDRVVLWRGMFLPCSSDPKRKGCEGEVIVGTADPIVFSVTHFINLLFASICLVLMF